MKCSGSACICSACVSCRANTARLGRMPVYLPDAPYTQIGTCTPTSTAAYEAATSCWYDACRQRGNMGYTSSEEQSMAQQASSNQCKLRAAKARSRHLDGRPRMAE